MNALVYGGPGKRNWEEVEDPKIVDDTDAVVEIDTTTICGTDLHILNGDVPEVEPGRILGHEAVGRVVERGAGVHRLGVGDRVLLSCVSACGTCRYCREGRFGQCLGGGGWIFGHLIDGVQAEYARVPFVETSAYVVPESMSDEDVLYLSDILPTAYEVGVLNGALRPADTVAIVGAGPIGLAAVMSAKLFTPARIVVIDPAPSRRRHAQRFGADVVASPAEAVEVVRDLTGGLGADVAIEAVGMPASFEQCTDLVRPGGHVANVGVHGAAATLHLERLWIRDVTITTGLVDTYTIPPLLKLIETGRLEPNKFTTHRFPMHRAMEAYETFSRAAETDALKVVLTKG